MKITKRKQEIGFKILDKIYAKGPISRIDISNETGITPATVSEITGYFIKDELIHETDEIAVKSSKSGRKKVYLDISAKHSFYIGAELSEKYLAFCLCDNKGTIFKKKIIKNSSKTLLTEVIFIDLLSEFILKSKDYNPKAIGVAIPGHFDDINKRIISNNPFWEKFDLGSIIQSVSLPIYFNNNVQCLALSERLFNSESTDPNFIFFHVSRGMFCSSMYLGNLYSENNVLVGEVGHTIVHPDGELCGCGQRGCLQTYASEASIIKKSQFLFNNSDSTYLRQLIDSPELLTINIILKAYHLGDEGVGVILHNAIKYLTITINNLSMMLDSQKIIIHGELFGDKLISDLLKESIEKSIKIFETNQSQVLQVKKYDDINSAQAACGLCIFRQLLQSA